MLLSKKIFKTKDKPKMRHIPAIIKFKKDAEFIF